MYLPKPTDSEFELAPAGTHLAVCYRVIDLGTQAGTYMGKPKSAHKILLSWELPDEKMKDGRPFSLSQKYTWSMSEKATLRKHLEGWRGKSFADSDFGQGGFDIRNILGKGCILTVAHAEKGDKTYANVVSVGKLMKGMEAPTASNDPIYLWIDESVWEESIFQKLSANLQGQIMQAPEYQKMLNGHDPREPPPADSPDDYNNDEFVPF